MVCFHPDNCTSRLKHFRRCFPTGSREAASDDLSWYSLQLPLQKAFSNWNAVCPHPSSHFNCCLIKKKQSHLGFLPQFQGGPRTMFMCALRSPTTDAPNLARAIPQDPLPSTAPGIQESPFLTLFTEPKLRKSISPPIPQSFCTPSPHPQALKPQWPGTSLPNWAQTQEAKSNWM